MRTRALQLAGILAALLFTSAAPAFGASKNVELVDNLPEAKNATAINFLDYEHQGDVMLVTGRFGLKSYSLTRPGEPRPARRDHGRGSAPTGRSARGLQPGRGAAVHVLAERGHGRRPQAQARAAVARPARVRRVDLTRAGRAGPERRDQHRGRLRGRRQGPEAAPAAELPAAADRAHDHLRQRAAGWLWTGGPASTTTQRDTRGWTFGRPIIVTDLSNPKQAARIPDGPGGPVPAGRRDGLLARRPGGRRGHRMGVGRRRHARLLDRRPPLRPGGGSQQAGHGAGADPICGRRAAGGGDRRDDTGGFEHNAWRPVGGSAPSGDPRYRRGELLLATEEDFGPPEEACRNRGQFTIASLEGSYDGEAWRSTPQNPFRLKAVGSWNPFGRRAHGRPVARTTRWRTSAQPTTSTWTAAR